MSGDLVCKAEKAERRATPDLLLRVDAALGADGALARLVPLLRAPDSPGESRRSAVQDAPAGSEGIPTQEFGAQTPMALPSIDTVAYWQALLVEHIRADNLLGPEPVIGLVRHQAPVLADVAKRARGRLHTRLVRLSVQYWEFLGWLNQDAGLPSQAMACTDRAFAQSIELADSRVVAYLLMRKSNIATDSGQNDLALDLAETAIQVADGLTAPERAVILRQKANALAGLRDVPRCGKAIGAAFEAAADETPASSELASYCTVGYVAMEAASSWIRLNQPEQAVAALEQAAQPWPAELRRDQGLFQVRLATAQALRGDIDQACVSAASAMEAAAATTSVRTRLELGRLVRQLEPWQGRDDVASVYARGRNLSVMAKGQAPAADIELGPRA